ncbi:hypothetical protein BT96DRAFT_950804, partial [Gymnopus androsaceus JB14]
HNKSPLSIYELSNTKAINRGYWHSDPGDSVGDVSEDSYRQEDITLLPTMDELWDDPYGQSDRELGSVEEEQKKDMVVNEDKEIQLARDVLQDFDMTKEDGIWGIDVYCQAVIVMKTKINMNQIQVHSNTELAAIKMSN